MLSKNAFGNLKNRYRAVLKKCHLLNTFGSLAVAGLLVMGTASTGMGTGSLFIEDSTPNGDFLLDPTRLYIQTNPILTEDKSIIFIDPDGSTSSLVDGGFNIGNEYSTKRLDVTVSEGLTFTKLASIGIRSGLAQSADDPTGADTRFILKEGVNLDVTSHLAGASGTYNEQSQLYSAAILDLQGGGFSVNMPMTFGHQSYVFTTPEHLDATKMIFTDMGVLNFDSGYIVYPNPAIPTSGLVVMGDFDFTDMDSVVHQNLRLHHNSWIFVDGTTTASEESFTSDLYVGNVGGGLTVNGLYTDTLLAVTNAENEFNVNRRLTVVNAENGFGLTADDTINMHEDIIFGGMPTEPHPSHYMSLSAPKGHITAKLNITALPKIYKGHWKLDDVSIHGGIHIEYGSTQVEFGNLEMQGILYVHEFESLPPVENPYVKIQNYNPVDYSIIGVMVDMDTNTDPNASVLSIENYTDHDELRVDVTGSTNGLGTHLKLNHNFVDGVEGLYSFRGGRSQIGDLTIADDALHGSSAESGEISIETPATLITNDFNIHNNGESDTTYLNIGGTLEVNSLNATGIAMNHPGCAVAEAVNLDIEKGSVKINPSQAGEALYADTVEVKEGSSLSFSNALTEDSMESSIINANIFNNNAVVNFESGVWKMAEGKSFETVSTTLIRENAHITTNDFKVLGTADNIKSQAIINGTLDVMGKTEQDENFETVSVIQNNTADRIIVSGGTLKAFEEALFSSTGSELSSNILQNGVSQMEFENNATLYIKDETAYSLDTLNNMLAALDKAAGGALVASQKAYLGAILDSTGLYIDASKLSPSSDYDFTLMEEGKYSSVYFGNNAATSTLGATLKADRLIGDGSTVELGNNSVILRGLDKDDVLVSTGTAPNNALDLDVGTGSLTLSGASPDPQGQMIGGGGTLSNIDASKGLLSIQGGDYQAQNIKLNSTNITEIRGALTSDSLEGGQIKIYNTVKTGSISNTQVQIGDLNETGFLSADNANAVHAFSDPSWENGLPAAKAMFGQISGGTSLHVGQNSYMAVGKDANGTVSADWLPEQMAEAGLP